VKLSATVTETFQLNHHFQF